MKQTALVGETRVLNGEIGAHRSATFIKQQRIFKSAFGKDVFTKARQKNAFERHSRRFFDSANEHFAIPSFRGFRAQESQAVSQYFADFIQAYGIDSGHGS